MERKIEREEVEWGWCWFSEDEGLCGPPLEVTLHQRELVVVDPTPQIGLGNLSFSRLRPPGFHRDPGAWGRGVGGRV